jgi:integrase/recombinase XerC
LSGSVQGPLRVGAATQLVVEELRARDTLAVETSVRVVGLVERFGRFVEDGLGRGSLGEVSAADVAAFTKAATARDGLTPSAATMRLRRWAVRLLFRTGRELGLCAHDPTIDVVLPSRSPGTARPLSENEVESCRRAALSDLSSTRLSTVWALGEATARTAEIPRCRVGDLNLDGGRVWLAGCHATRPRWGALSEWGVTQLARRLDELAKAAPETPLAYRGDCAGETPRSVSAQGLRETLERSGIAARRGVAPGSLTGWAGRQVLAESGRIEAVARALGVRSLDAAARMIAWDWAAGLESGG